ncbi:MAG: NIL domain-containing protein [Oscillatoriophycideae cyanobacterium NC_groundwater_1537_Pr4_S-0.65um_50_18]|nr:NIL domain-containing protein [Oscillatoriophycideae cyanobacterium NC_groundwater_1537_Pr4_S-0.65um_50_18]
MADRLVHLRIRVCLSHNLQQEFIISQLRSKHGLRVNMAGAMRHTQPQQRKLDLELTGSIAQVQSGLTYLESLNLRLEGRPNPDGDSWYY